MLLKNLRTFTLAPERVKNTNLRISGSEIAAEGPSLEPIDGEEVVDLKGKLVLPGFVNAHTHLYSSLSRGMPAPSVPPSDFTEILQRVWWKLDVSLDEETTYYSALVGAIDAIRCGTTTLFDHHAAPSSITGSLDVIRKALEQVGMRGVLCYEVTDRGGEKKRDEGLEENERFIKRSGSDEYFRGLVGAHAAFTLSDESLRLCGEMAARYGTGVHIHVSEDLCDVRQAKEDYAGTVTERLAANGILSPMSILAHGVHLASGEFEAISKNRCWVVHNPRSNMNNRVGYADIQRFANRTALGTDGFPSDMLEEARFAFFKRQDSRVPGDIDFADLFTGGHRMASQIFERQFGTFGEGAVADLVVLDYSEPTPVRQGNLLGHYLFGMASSSVESVMVGGKWVMTGRRILGLNEDEIFARSRQLADGLWRRMEKIA